MSADETRDQSGNTPEQIVTDALVMTDLSDYAGTDMGMINEAAGSILKALRAAGLLLDGAPTADQLELAREDHIVDERYSPRRCLSCESEWPCPSWVVFDACETTQSATGVAPPAPSEDCPECGDSMCRCDVDWTPAARPAPSADREPTTDEYREGYESWKSFGIEAHRALLEIWHLASSTDTSHMTFGDSPQVVIDVVRDALAAPAPVDEAKLAEVIHRASHGDVCDAGIRLSDVWAARAVREYLEGIR